MKILPVEGNMKKKRFYCIKGKTDDLLGGFILLC